MTSTLLRRTTTRVLAIALLPAAFAVGQVYDDVGPSAAEVADTHQRVAEQPAEPGYAGRWVGHTYTAEHGVTRLLSAGYRAHGNFWFTVAATGDITGYAVVSYAPMVSVAGANGVLSYAKSVGVAAIGALPLSLPGFGSLVASMELGKLVGFQGYYSNPMPTKAGPITGRLHGGQLSLRWRDGKQKELPLKIYADYLKHNEKVADRGYRTKTPWPGEAEVTHTPGRWRAVMRDTDRSAGDDVSKASTAVWSVHKVGAR